MIAINHPILLHLELMAPKTINHQSSKFKILIRKLDPLSFFQIHLHQALLFFFKTLNRNISTYSLTSNTISPNSNFSNLISLNPKFFNTKPI